MKPPRKVVTMRIPEELLSDATAEGEDAIGIHPNIVG
jgi:hypothetical protein